MKFDTKYPRFLGRKYVSKCPVPTPKQHILSIKWVIIYSGVGLTHWGRATQICVVKLTTIGSDNGFSPGRHQTIIWTNAGILLIGPIGTNLSEILIIINTFSFKKMHLKMSCAKWRPFCLGLNVLMTAECQAISWIHADLFSKDL